MRDTKAKLILASMLLILLLQFSSIVLAAPSGEIYFPETGDDEAHNVLETGNSTTVTVSFKNTAGADINDVASTIQYITIAAANLDSTRTSIDLNTTWEIYPPNSTTPRASGAVTGTRSNGTYSPYSTTTPVELYIWRLGPPSNTLWNYTDPNQFGSDLRVLRPGEVLNFTVTVRCLNKVGDSVIWFFFKASEDEFEGKPYPTSIDQINDRCNLYYSKLPGGKIEYWLPLHNSYDPYDPNLGTGHSFWQHSWRREPTTHAFAKANKHVHQKLAVPPAEVYTFHICGVKFLDVDGNGVWKMGIDQPVNGVELWLLAKTSDGRYVLADKEGSPYYGKIKVIEEHGNPVVSGEGGKTLPGHYCFNLNVTAHGIYELYIWLNEANLPAGYRVYPAIENKTLIINATLIGPIILITGKKEFSYDNNFANYPPPVGGIIVAATKNSPLTFEPHLAFTAALAGLTGAALAYATIRRRLVTKHVGA